MSQHDPMMRVHHMLDHAREAAEMVQMEAIIEEEM